MYLRPKMSCDGRVLKILSLAASGAAIGTLILAIATDFWIFTNEVRDFTKEDANESIKLHGDSQQGLWRLCLNCRELDQQRGCYYISYLSAQNETTLEEQFGCVEVSITLAKQISLASTLVVSGFSVLVIAAGVSLIGNFKEDIRTLIGGVLFVISGLTLMMALITYISAVNDQVHHHPAPKEDEEDGVGFSYSYGVSFYIAGISFFCTKIGAVVCISLYFKRYKINGELDKIVPGLYKLEALKSADNVTENASTNTPDTLPAPPRVVGNTSPTIIY